MAGKDAPGATVTETMTSAAMLARVVAFDTTIHTPNFDEFAFIRAWPGRHAVLTRAPIPTRFIGSPA